MFIQNAEEIVRCGDFPVHLGGIIFQEGEKGFIADLFFNYICLTEEVGELGRILKQTWRQQDQLLSQVGNRREAHDLALDATKAHLQAELADALAYLLKIANDAGIDLELAYLKKMGENLQRAWPSD